MGSARRVSNSSAIEKPTLKVPKENNRFLCWPPAHASQQLLASNQAILTHSNLPNWFRRLRSLAREQAVIASKKYMSDYAPTLAESIAIGDTNLKPLVLGGHQPELFHPGVWFKNFLMSEIGRFTNSIGLQVIIDHDVARSDTLRVPSCSMTLSKRAFSEFAQRSIPLPIREISQPRMPWHATLTRHLDPAAWSKTIDDVAQSMADCGLTQPLLFSRRETLAHCLSTNTNIGDAFSKFRHRIEMENGVFNLEVPIGHLCDDTAFGYFVRHCVLNAEALWTSYNDCRDAYRTRRRIRNQAQPVLELQKRDTSLELPFWIYRSKGEAVIERKRLWVCKQRNGMLLCDHPDAERRTVAVEMPSAEVELPGAWNAFVQSGICIRPRALMTTLFLRCFVADLFVHGIGGGTYDELTDDIMNHWLDIVPPTFLTSSASLQLPFSAHSEIKTIDPSSSGQAIERELQLMRSVPERFLDHAIESERVLFERHATKIANIPMRGSKRQWHLETAQLKQRIEAAIEPKKRVTLAKQESFQSTSQQNKILKSREYSFVLFEEQDAVGRLSKMARAAMNPGIEAGK